MPESPAAPDRPSPPAASRSGTPPASPAPGTTPASPPSGAPPDRAAAVRLGHVLRAARRERGLTLTQLAAAAELSQPFLSQLELGRSRPSMRSLYRIAEALGTTQQQLLAAASPPVGSTPARAGAAELVDNDVGGARLLLHRPGAVDVTEFVGLAAEWGDWFSHGRTETLYVVRGHVEVELRDPAPARRTVLVERDTLTYPGATGHRYRQLGPAPCVLLVLHHGT